MVRTCRHACVPLPWFTTRPTVTQYQRLSTGIVSSTIRRQATMLPSFRELRRLSPPHLRHLHLALERRHDLLLGARRSALRSGGCGRNWSVISP